MVRRQAYTKLEKQGQVRPEHVQGMGDVVFKGFQCLAPECRAFIFVRTDEIEADFRIPCPDCGTELVSGGETKFFDYRLVRTDTGEVIEEGPFVILHDDYLSEARRFKYCVLCYTRKPVELFDRHSSRASGYQSECRLCKTIYNGIKNQSRITDQHREAAQRRRLYRQLAEEGARINSRAIYDKFEGKCFNCGTALEFAEKGKQPFQIDHTLPASLLWPLTTENATLLCSRCNNEKHDRWPSAFYDVPKLKRLATRTGYEYALLAGPPRINEAAVTAIVEDADGFIETWIHYPEEIKKVRRLIRDHEKIDIFEHAEHVPDHLREPDEIAAEE
jgi:5-methylcytosine-specific restriction endonuclease McrA